MQSAHDAPDLVAAIPLAGFTGGFDKPFSNSHEKNSKQKGRDQFCS